MKRIFTFLAVSALTFFCICCDKDNGTSGDLPKTIDLTTKQSTFIDEGNGFALDYLDNILASTDKDLIVSPLSMQFLLGMVLDGAKGETADQIAAVLGYGRNGASEVNEFCFKMLTELPALDSKATKVNIANAIFVDKGYSLLESYTKDVSHFYEAEVSKLDFTKTKESADIINKWCSKQTSGLIPKMLEEVSPDMLAYLLNALYFKSKWQSPFEKSNTADEKFTSVDGKESKVKMMKRGGDMLFGEGKSFKTVCLPYGNGAFSMTVLLPKEGYTTAQVVEDLRATGIAKLSKMMSSSNVSLWLPRFETKFSIRLNDILIKMGMSNAFTPLADFSAMSPAALCLSFVKQDAVITVDETGTEAAAVSIAGMPKNSAGPDDTKVFHADRPFLYLIRENSTGAVLFAGRFGNVQ